MKYEVYKNLHKGMWSLRENNKGKRKVVGHYDSIMLTNVTFHVSENGKKRVRKTKVKNVHAYIAGHLISAEANNFSEHMLTQMSLFEITYDPYKHDNFVFKKKADRKRFDWIIDSNVPYKSLVIFRPSGKVYLSIYVG